MKSFDIVLSGLGGQGVMTVLQILAVAASKEKIQVKIFEGTGITQRGGGVFGFVRLGDTYGPKIPVGMADAVVSLEISEVVSVIHYLKPQGQVWTNSGRTHGYYTKLHPQLYPAQGELEALIRLRTQNLYLIPADRLAQEGGGPQGVNMVMLGAFSAGNFFLKSDSMAWAIEKNNKKFSSLNLEAFWKGYHFVEGIIA